MWKARTRAKSVHIIIQNSIYGISRFTANHPDLARTLHSFARLQEGLGTLPTAAALYQRALTIREQVYGPHHPQTSETRERLQAVLHLMDKDENGG